MLHGSAGAFTVHGAEEPLQDNFGEKSLAHSCFAVVLPHYFEAFGRESITDKAKLISLFPSLLSCVKTLLRVLEQHSWVDRRRIFLYGESLGGYLAIAVAFQSPEVVAVSEFSGGLPSGVRPAVRPQPLEVMISHGGSDTLVPVSAARALYAYCIRRGFPVTMTVYPGVGHYLPDTVQTSILRRTISLFSGGRNRAAAAPQ